MNGVALDLKLNLVLLLGTIPNPRPTPVEVALDELLRIAARTTLNNARKTGKFARLLAVTNDPRFEPDAGIELCRDKVEGEGQNFHFGRALRVVAANFPTKEGLVYLGGGAGLLLSEADWEGLQHALESGLQIITANNYFSADLVGWRPLEALIELPEAELPDSDNNLAWALCRRAGLGWQPMLPGNARSLGMQFDLDTPTEVAILKVWLEQNLESWPHLSPVNEFLRVCREFDTIPARELRAALSDEKSEVLVCGRVSAGVHHTLELRSHGQTRLLSEERGMRAGGREARGEVESLAGFLLEALGPKRFFEKLAKSADAAILDSRVLFAHLKCQPDRADRCNSDAFRPELIANPVVRAFTEAALEARLRWNFPVLLGGHSAVSGGLLLLLELVPPRSGG